MPASQVAEWIRGYTGLFTLAPAAATTRQATGTAGPAAPIDSGE
jgi:hypothetical protein